MAHAQKTDFVFRRNGRVHLNAPLVHSTTGSRGVRFSASNTGIHHVPRYCEGYWLPIPFAIFPFTSPPVRHLVPSHFNRSLPNSVLKNTGSYTLLKPKLVALLLLLFEFLEIPSIGRHYATKLTVSGSIPDAVI